MAWYCEKCKKIHNEDELCPGMKQQLSKHPEWVTGTANFVSLAGEEQLITTQTLDKLAQNVNKHCGTNLSYEGTQQFARDIQVFKRLNEEAFSKSGHFSSPINAKGYYENILEKAKANPKALSSFESKLTGYSQEVDWLRDKQGSLSALVEKSSLLGNNAPGIDGTTVCRYNGQIINRTTIKASKNSITSSSTAIRDVKKAIEKGYATEKDIIYAPVGAEDAARDAGLKNPVVEKHTPSEITESNGRLENKILNMQAVTEPTLSQILGQMSKGAIIGAAVSLTISSITTYVKFKNGEMTIDEAYKLICEDVLKGGLVGAGLAGVSIFLPGGLLGGIAGISVGIYFDKECSSILDEAFGKGVYITILNSSGYIYGSTYNLAERYNRIEENLISIKSYLSSATEIDEELAQCKIRRHLDQMKTELLFDTSNWSTEEYDDIRTAIKRLCTASENQYVSIKQEAWYKRLFNRITFSNKNWILVTEQIRTVSQMQEILVSILEKLSDVDEGIARIVVDAMSYIRELQNNNIILSNKIDELCKKVDLLIKVVFDIKKDLDISMLSETGKVVLKSCLYELSKRLQNSSEEQKFFANSVISNLGNCDRSGKPFDLIKYLDEISRQRILACCMVYLYLKETSTDIYSQYTEFLEEFNIGNKTIQLISQNIDDLYELCGIQGFFFKYGIVKEHTTSLKFDVNQTAYKAPNAEESFEEEFISQVLIIGQGDIKKYYKKKLHNPYIVCDGRIEISDCILYYNESKIPFKITLGKGAEMLLRNTTIICKGIDKTELIHCSQDNSIQFTNCRFIECSYFLRGDKLKSLTIKNCVLENCLSYFVRVFLADISKCSIIGNRILQNRKVFSEYDYIREPVFKIGSIGTSGNSCTFENNYIDQMEEDNRLKIRYIDCNFATVKNCTFKGINEAIRVLSIENSEFIQCNHCIELAYAVTDSYATVQKCLFVRATNVIKARPHVTIRDCIFVSCFNELISASLVNAIRIIQCIFSDIRLTEQNTHETPCCIKLACKTRNTVEDSIFDGINIEKGYLIAENRQHIKDGYICDIVSTSFAHCVTKNEDRKLNSNTIKISDSCRGIEKTNLEGGISDYQGPSEEFRSKVGCKLKTTRV